MSGHPSTWKFGGKHVTKVCKVEGCNREHKARDMCKAHYWRWLTHGDPQPDIPIGDLINGESVTMGCKVDDCGRKHHANGYCRAHNKRVQRHGDPMPDKPIREHSEPQEWPLDALMARHEVDPDTGCWLWTAGTSDGYGMIWIDGQMVLAHRYAYAKANYLTLEDIEGDWICHHCDEPSCVRPGHLYRGDAQTNNEDRELTDLSIQERRELRAA